MIRFLTKTVITTARVAAAGLGVAIIGVMQHCGTAQAAETRIVLAYIELVRDRPPTLSNLDEIPSDEGLAGARLGIADTNTTGQFLNQKYELLEYVVQEAGQLERALVAATEQTPFVLLNLDQAPLQSVLGMAAGGAALFFNAGAPDMALREAGCDARLLHTLPSRRMLTDGLIQFAVKKRWSEIALVTGPRAGDQAFATALKASARKFGARIIAESTWRFDADIRRNAAQEVPLFTQDFGDHDMLVVADEVNDFARYFLYHSWLPRPVAGGAGLVPSAWSGSVEQHGAAQLQNRFKEAAGRTMRPIDYAAWLAVRSVGEAVTRAQSVQASDVRAYLLSEKFNLAGFKGRGLSFRPWNGQMRQPIPLTHPEAIAALAPLEGFLHQFSELDTLGLDRGEARCTEFE